jgi:hypothetical protein
MDAVTYPNTLVADFMEKMLIPLRVPFDHEPLGKDFNVKWTPTLVILDADGREHHRNIGYLSPEELVPELLLGIGKTQFNQGDYRQGMDTFDRILSNHPRSHAAPQAIYFRGVCEYKGTSRPDPLKEAYRRLQAEWPVSEWAIKAAPYRLL